MSFVSRFGIVQNTVRSSNSRRTVPIKFLNGNIPVSAVVEKGDTYAISFEQRSELPERIY